MTPEISVVILCYKEGKRLSSFVNRTVNLLERSFTSWEIVLVANYWDNIELIREGITNLLESTLAIQF